MRLTTRGIKGHDLSLELGRHTILVGDNGSGKSTAAEAVRFGVLGYIPALGKRPVDVAALMHGDSMSVEITLEGGRVVRRSISRKDEGFTAWAEASWLKNGKQAEHDKEIKKILGEEEIDVAECLDIRQLLAATPNQRAARMDQLLNAGLRSADEIADAVARLWIMRLADTTEDRMPKEYMKAFELIPEAQQPVVREVAPMLYGKIKEANLAGAITWANAEKREKSEGLKQKEAAAHELRKRAAEVPEPDERDITRLESEQKKLLQELGAAKQRKLDYELRLTNLGTLKEQLDATEERAKQTDRQAIDAEAVHGKAIQDLKERGEALLKEMASIKPAPEEDDSKVRALEDEARQLNETANGREIPAIPDTAKQERSIDDLKARIKLAELSEWSEVLTVAQEIEDVAGTKGMKTAIAKPVKRLRELAKKGLGTDPADLKHELDLARKELESIATRKTKAEAERKRALAEQGNLSQRAEEAMSEAIQLRAEMSRRRRAAMQDFEEKRGAMGAERQKLDRALEAHRKALEGARAEKATVDRHLASLRDRLQGAGDTPQPPADPSAIEARLKASGHELQKLISDRATHGEIHKVLGEIEAAKAAAVVFAAIEWALQRQREAEISNSGGPLMRIMSEFLKASGRKETPYVRASNGNCAIGWRTTDGLEVQIQSLSGGEWVLFAAALAAAVILCRKSALKILLVEAGETDSKTLTQLLEGIQGVNREDLMTAIVMSPRAPSERIDHLEAWDIIRTGESKEAAVSAA